MAFQNGKLAFLIFTQDQDNLSWPKNFKTNLDASSYGHKPGQIYNDYHYTLDTILFFLKNSSEKHNAYCQRAKSAGIETVRSTHKKAIINLFTSGGEYCSYKYYKYAFLIKSSLTTRVNLKVLQAFLVSIC